MDKIVKVIADMNTKIKISIIFILLITLFACTPTTRMQKEKEDESKDAVGVVKPEYKNPEFVKINKIYSWLNVMPNAGERFHITGEIELAKSDSQKFEVAEIFRVIVFQDNREIYQILPKTVVSEEKSDDKKLVLIFSTLTGMKPKPELSLEKPITAEIHISDKNGIFKIVKSDIIVEKIY